MNKKEWKEKNEQEEKKKLEELTEMFRKYGANNPESWARSVANPEIKPYKTNQITRFSLLKALTSEVLKESDTAWIGLQLNKDSKNERSPLSQLSPAIKEMVDKGVNNEAIVDMVRVIQYETLFHVLLVLDGQCNTETPVNNWGLFEKNEDDSPANEINLLYESLLGFDPDNREFRPRST